ncbi:MAG: T9SS type A sorting domain-containing protein [Saprospiraceae bacterium]|nr:T9SS type A sorting domain-containing protein [Saprospiraceae bacterium]
MKNLLLLLLIPIFIGNLYSQKEDFKWLLGYSHRDNPLDTAWGSTFLDFETPDGNPLMYYDGYKKIDFHVTSANICDHEGNYLFSCNGVSIEDSSNQLMKNANQLNGVDNYPTGESINQGALIVPYPGYAQKYIVFHKTAGLYQNYGASCNELLYSIVEYNSSNPLGSVIKRRVSLVKDTLDDACLTATKHANGRDWWVIVSEGNNIGYYIFLLTKYGINLHHKQVFVGKKEGGGFGHSFFSNNGNYFATSTSSDNRQIQYDNLYFFTFDRCSGMLDNLSYVQLPFQETWSTGCSFSPDNKLIYVVTAKNLYQYSISDKSLTKKELIAQYDGYAELVVPPSSFWSTYFGMLQQAPDGRIYGAGVSSSCRSIDVIDKPDENGLNCSFKPHSLKSITVKTILPSFPNYRLGPIDGSICDTLGIDNIPWCHWRYNQDTVNYLDFLFTDLSAYEVETWCWDFGDPVSGSNNTSMEKNPLHKFSANGIYNVCLIVKNKNGADTLCRTIKIGNVVSTINQKIAVEINTFPNPCKDFLVVNVVDYNPEKMILRLYDELGQNALIQKLRQGSNVVDVKSLYSGIYFLSILEKGNEIKTESILKN